ncbi:unnamed protein product [Amoebophrya sp. A120]|nr:unnamed protein product [Amoebophrya sp. A120]|eukprot:GSA120T00012501001.1
MRAQMFLSSGPRERRRSAPAKPPSSLWCHFCFVALAVISRRHPSALALATTTKAKKTQPLDLGAVLTLRDFSYHDEDMGSGEAVPPLVAKNTKLRQDLQAAAADSIPAEAIIGLSSAKQPNQSQLNGATITRPERYYEKRFFLDGSAVSGPAAALSSPEDENKDEKTVGAGETTMSENSLLPPQLKRGSFDDNVLSLIRQFSKFRFRKDTIEDTESTSSSDEIEIQQTDVPAAAARPDEAVAPRPPLGIREDDSQSTSDGVFAPPPRRVESTTGNGTSEAAAAARIASGLHYAGVPSRERGNEQDRARGVAPASGSVSTASTESGGKRTKSNSSTDRGCVSGYYPFLFDDLFDKKLYAASRARAHARNEARVQQRQNAELLHWPRNHYGNLMTHDHLHLRNQDLGPAGPELTTNPLVHPTGKPQAMFDELEDTYWVKSRNGGVTSSPSSPSSGGTASTADGREQITLEPRWPSYVLWRGKEYHAASNHGISSFLLPKGFQFFSTNGKNHGDHAFCNRRMSTITATNTTSSETVSTASTCIASSTTAAHYGRGPDAGCGGVKRNTCSEEIEQGPTSSVDHAQRSSSSSSSSSSCAVESLSRQQPTLLTHSSRQPHEDPATSWDKTDPRCAFHRPRGVPPPESAECDGIESTFYFRRQRELKRWTRSEDQVSVHRVLTGRFLAKWIGRELLRRKARQGADEGGPVEAPRCGSGGRCTVPAFSSCEGRTNGATGGSRETTTSHDEAKTYSAHQNDGTSQETTLERTYVWLQKYHRRTAFQITLNLFRHAAQGHHGRDHNINSPLAGFTEEIRFTPSSTAERGTDVPEVKHLRRTGGLPIPMRTGSSLERRNSKAGSTRTRTTANDGAHAADEYFSVFWHVKAENPLESEMTIFLSSNRADRVFDGSPRWTTTAAASAGLAARDSKNGIEETTRNYGGLPGNSCEYELYCDGQDLFESHQRDEGEANGSYNSPAASSSGGRSTTCSVPGSSPPLPSSMTPSSRGSPSSSAGSPRRINYGDAASSRSSTATRPSGRSSATASPSSSPNATPPGSPGTATPVLACYAGRRRSPHSLLRSLFFRGGGCFGGGL